MKARVLIGPLLSTVVFGQVASRNQPVPITMTKLVVRLQSPDVPEASFAAQPKAIYRAGTRYCRIEEWPDTEHGIHGLVIINEPDTWLVNLLTKKAQHMVDSGPTFNCRLPIFVVGENVNSAADMHNPLMELEFGRELTYFVDKAATSRLGPTLQGKATKAYTVKLGDSQLLLFTSGTPEKPVAVVKEDGSKREAYWYGFYEEVPFDAELFAKPEGVKIEGVKP